MLSLVVVQPGVKAQDICPLPPRLTADGRGQIVPGDPVYIRAEPSRFAPAIGWMRSMRVFQVLAGPQCAEGRYWWQVQNNEAEIGWVAEGADGHYWLQPYAFDCETALALGEPAITRTRLTVYASADFAAAEVGIIPDGALVEVGTEIRCAYNLPWVSVTYAGMTGWVSAIIEGASAYGVVYALESRPVPFEPVIDAAARLLPPVPPVPTLSTDAIWQENVNRLSLAQTLGEGLITDFTWSPDGDELAVATTLNLRVYDAEDAFTASHEADGHDANIEIVRYSPDGSRLASADLSGRLVLWDAAALELVDTMELEAPIINAVFSPDSAQLAVSIRSRPAPQVIVMQADGVLRELYRIPMTNGLGRETDIAFSPDSGRLVVIESGGTHIHVWNNRIGREMFVVDMGPAGGRSIGRWALSPDGRFLTFQFQEAIGDTTHVMFNYLIALDLDGGNPPPDMIVRIDEWDANAGDQTVLQFTPEGDAIWFLWNGILSLTGGGYQLSEPSRVLDDGVHGFASALLQNIIATAENPGDIQLYTYTADNPRQLRASHTLRGTASSVGTMQFNPAGTRLAALSGESTLHIWDSVTGQNLAMIQAVGAGYPFAVRDGLVLSQTEIWDSQQGTLVDHFDLPADTEVLTVGFSPADEPLAVVWDRTNGAHSLRNLQDASNLALIEAPWLDENGFSSDGRSLAVGLSVLDTTSLQTVARLAPQFGMAHTALLSPDNRLLLIFDGGSFAFEDTSALLLRDIATGDLLLNLPLDASELDSVTWSRSGRWISWAMLQYQPDDSATLVTVLDLQTQEQHSFSIPRLRDAVEIQFTPDEELIVLGQVDGRVQFYQWSSGQLVHEYQAHESAITQLLFSDDGSALYTAGDDNTLRIWRIGPPV